MKGLLKLVQRYGASLCEAGRHNGESDGHWVRVHRSNADGDLAAITAHLEAQEAELARLRAVTIDWKAAQREQIRLMEAGHKDRSLPYPFLHRVVDAQLKVKHEEPVDATK